MSSDPTLPVASHAADPTLSPELQALCHWVMQLPGLVTLKTLDSRVIVMNDRLAPLLGAPSAELMGHYEQAFGRGDSEASVRFRQQDLDTIERRHRRYLDILAYADNKPRAILSQKTCLVDPAGKPVAILFQGIDISTREFGNIDALLLEHVRAGREVHPDRPYSYALDDPRADSPLKAREGEVLFYLLHGRTARGVAEVLHLSVRTVEGYIDELKYTFRCDSKADLVEKAIAYGYSNYLPESLLRT